MDRTDPTAGAGIERVAQELRDRWQVLRVLHGTPDVLQPDQLAVRGVFAGYDRWLVRACHMMGIDVPPSRASDGMLGDTQRRELRQRLADAGWQL